MTAKLHSLLKRQLKRHFDSTKQIPAELESFISAVNNAYVQSDDDRNMLERSLELSSEELLQANSELRAIFQALPDLFFIVTNTGKILDIKAGNTNDLLLQPSKLIGKNIYDVYRGQVGIKFLHAIERLDKGKQLVTIEYSMRLAKKDNIYEARLLPLREKQILAVVRNVTEQKNAQHALKESEARYRKVLEASPDPIIAYDMQGRATYINPAFSKVFGWTIDEIYLKEVDYVPKEYQGDTQKLMEMAISGEGLHAVETRRNTKSGKTIDVSVSAAVWRDLTGEPAGSVITLRDITEKKELEARLFQVHKMEAIGMLAGGIAHDFNNLLMGLQGTTSLMLSQIDCKHPFFEKINVLEYFIKSGSELTKQLLGFAQRGKYEIKPSDINKIIKKSADMFGRTRKEIEINLDLAESLWPVEVDQGQIEQVLLNLYVNAWQAMPDGGQLHVKTENLILDNGSVRTENFSQRRYIKMTVADTGIGIDKDLLPKIFEPFFTTKGVGKGTGLGLASAYGIIKNHGGSIEVSSEINQGTTFTIFLPATEKKVEEKKVIPDQIVCGTETILFIDDEKMIRDVGLQMLGMLGYKVIVAVSAEEASQIYQNSFQLIDLVILDLIMPQCGGGKVFDQIRQINPQAKVLLSSGYSVDGEAAAILRRGCKGFIQKPFNMKQLSRKIREVLEN